MSCFNGVLDQYAARFLVNHPNLHWVPVEGQELTATSGLVTVRTERYQYFFARKNLTENDQTYTIVSKAFPDRIMKYSDGITKGDTKATDYEVLSCV